MRTDVSPAPPADRPGRDQRLPRSAPVRSAQDHVEHRTLARWTRQQAGRAGRAHPRECVSIRGSIVLAHLWLADSTARRFVGRGEDLDDLQQVARAALVEAVNRYRPGDGDFIPFAVPTITGVLKRHFRDHAWAIRPPRRTQEVAVTIRREWPALAQALGKSPTAADLAAHLGCAETDVRRAQLADRGYDNESLDDDVSSVDRRPSDGDEPSRVADTALVVRRACADLDPQDRWLLYLRFAEERTQSDIARRLGISQIQVSRRLARLLRRMRTVIGSLDPAGEVRLHSDRADLHTLDPGAGLPGG